MHAVFYSSPFLIALYPILYFYEKNFGRMFASEMLLPILLSWSSIFILLFAFKLFLRTSAQRVVAVSALTVGFFLIPASAKFLSAHLSVNRDVSILAATVVLCLAPFLLAKFGSTKILEGLSQFLFVSSVTALLFLSVPIGRKAHTLHQKSTVTREHISKIQLRDTTKTPPDIYYIILDGFGRADRLQEIYGFDSWPLLNKLRELDFFIADKSRSNYSQTLLSLGSSLNMQYLDTLARGDGVRSKNRGPVQRLLFENKVAKIVRKAGYRFVFFPSGYSGTEIRDVDERIASPFAFSEYQNVLLAKSPLPDLFRAMSFGQLKNIQYVAHRAQIRFIFDSIGKLKEDAAPRFIFAHILAPHPPFVFDKEGNAKDSSRMYRLIDGNFFIKRASKEEYIHGYREQAQYILTEVTKSVSEIIRNDPSAIIVIQGDHGPGSGLVWNDVAATNADERLSILNVYRVPESMRKKLYPSITPVNTFRIILGDLLTVDTPILPDNSYLSPWKFPYEFHEIK